MLAGMARYFEVHPHDPQPRSIASVAKIVTDDGVVAYPTDSGFALGTAFGNRTGIERIRRLRQLPLQHHLSVVVSEFAQLGRYVEMDNRVFRAIKACTPGPYTFVLQATKEVPRIMQHPRARTIGVRIPKHVTALALARELDMPIVTSSLILPGRDAPMVDGWQIHEELDHELDAVLDSGDAGTQSTTVIDLSGPEPVLLRQGGGDPALFEV